MRLFFAAVVLCAAGAANALTVTFDHTNVTSNPANFENIGESQGFTYDFSYTYLTGQHIALHDDSGLTSSTIQAANGSKFTPISIDTTGFSQVYKTGPGPDPDPNSPSTWDTSGIAPPITLAFQGVLNNQVVATQSVSTSQSGNNWTPTWSTTQFSSAFKGIDSLVLSLQFPTVDWKDYGPPDNAPSNFVWCPVWCGEYWADNLVVTTDVAPVPLPASGFLLLGGLLGLLGFRRIRA
ncbi:hypothetical protein [Ruegeria sp.]|uniref:hypothetical protein n=1 Tax=Ruegeria sp. TaxID=1879320 RepID=UPI003C7C799F